MHEDEVPAESLLAPLDEAAAVQAVAEPKAAAEAAEPEPDDFGEFAWPEGYAADPEAMAKFLPLAREMGLGKEKAQQLATLYAELDQERNAKQAAFIAQNNAEWLKEIHAHPEFGGQALSRTAENVAAVMRRFGTPLLAQQVRQMQAGAADACAELAGDVFLSRPRLEGCLGGLLPLRRRRRRADKVRRAAPFPRPAVERFNRFLIFYFEPQRAQRTQRTTTTSIFCQYA